MRPILLTRLFPTLLLVGCGEFGLGETLEAGGAALVAVAPGGQLRFAEASPSGRSQALEVTIASDGDVAAYVAAVWVESENGGIFYTNDELPFPKLMEPGEAIPITVRFMPAAPGTFHGTLLVESGTEGALLERQLLGEACGDDDGDGRC
ncbi:MAG: hypothetical protein Q8P18_06400 [Pseudomonadota bacterium]|nr:hypothetical protein [Pseudomonadota bacterium]